MMSRKWFTDQCNHWYKLWSSWLAVLWGMIVSAVWVDPTVLKEITDAVPDQYRVYLSPLVMGVVTALPILVRLLKQNIGKRGS
jgi:hypothetical protein